MTLLVTGGAGYLGSELLRQRPDALATFHHTLDVNDADPRVVFRPTLATGHFTVWACENLLLASIRAIEPIERVQPG